jgi:hypothetical protein
VRTRGRTLTVQGSGLQESGGSFVACG